MLVATLFYYYMAVVHCITSLLSCVYRLTQRYKTHSPAMAASQQFVIVRELPGIGASSQEQLAGASDTSNKANAQVRPSSCPNRRHSVHATTWPLDRAFKVHAQCAACQLIGCQL